MDESWTENGQPEMLATEEHLLLEVRRALTHLYDVVYLQNSPLVGMLGRMSGEKVVPGQEGKALRKVLLEVVDQLMPGDNVGLRSRERRGYAVLRARYVEQSSEEKVAASMGLGPRQVRREIRLGLEAVARVVHGRMEGRVGKPISGQSTEAEMQEWCLDVGSVNICAEVRNVEALVSPLAREREVILQDAALPQSVMVQANRVLLRQVLLTLYTWFIRSYGHSTVESSVYQPNANVATLEICCPEANRHITKRRNESDLVIPVELLQTLQGKVEQEPSLGTRHYLKLTLPCSPMHVVLLVDDNRSIHRLFKRYLSGLPYQVLSAYDAKAGVAMAHAEHPDVIVMDIMMPDQDGWEMLGSLQSGPATCDIPVVVCSVLEQETLARSLGSSGYIKKPVTQNALLAALKSLRVRGVT